MPRNKRKQIQPKAKDLVPGTVVTLHRRRIVALTKSASDSGQGYSFRLTDFADADIISLFQMYKITSVRLTFRLVNAPNNNATFPTLHLAPNNFSDVTPTSIDEVRQYNNLSVYQFGPSKVQYSRTFTPSQLVDLVGTTAGRGVMPPTWTAITNDTVIHLCAVWWLQRFNTTSDPTHTIELDTDITVQCKGPR